MTQGSTSILDGVLAWIVATQPTLSGSYNYIPAQKDQAFPDVVCEIDRIAVSANDTRLPFSALQNVLTCVYEIGVSFMVENSNPATAAQYLRDTADLLVTSLLNDYTLGGRVPFASPTAMTFDFTRPFVQYMDGTKAREATGVLVVGVPINSEESW